MTSKLGLFVGLIICDVSSGMLVSLDCRCCLLLGLNIGKFFIFKNAKKLRFLMKKKNDFCVGGVAKSSPASIRHVAKK